MEGNKLHQLLAVESDLAQQSRAIAEETVTTFTKKADHFDGLIKVYTPDDDAGEKIPPEIKEVVTTVQDKLDYSMKSMVKAINATLSKEETNSSGKANAPLIVEDTNFGTFSATSFIAMERYLEKIRDTYKNIPTLDPTCSWTKKDTTGKVLYESVEDVKYRYVKKSTPVTLSPATDKHPAQVQLVISDSQVGKYVTVYRSGRLTPTEKSNLLERIDNIILEVKKAREKANQADVKNVEVGKMLFDFIHK
jgi:hypothetical protein